MFSILVLCDIFDPFDIFDIFDIFDLFDKGAEKLWRVYLAISGSGISDIPI